MIIVHLPLSHGQWLLSMLELPSIVASSLRSLTIFADKQLIVIQLFELSDHERKLVYVNLFIYYRLLVAQTIRIFWETTSGVSYM